MTHAVAPTIDVANDFGGCVRIDTLKRDIVEVQGPDARSFLQSLVSQDLDGVVPGGGTLSLLLAPQGKLVAAFRLICIDETTFWADCDAGVGATLRDGLARFKIRVKAELAIRPDVGIVMLRGHNVNEVLTANSIAAPSQIVHAWTRTNDVVAIRTSWRGLDGVDLVVAVASPMPIVGAATLAAAQAETLRIECGVLLQGTNGDIDDSTIAQEAHLEQSSVSFTKGCFVGQELVCRIDSRGHVNRFVRHIVLDASVAASELPDAAVVKFGDKVVGTISSRAPQGSATLGTVRREVEPGATVEVDGHPATVFSLVETP